MLLQVMQSAKNIVGIHSESPAEESILH